MLGLAPWSFILVQGSVQPYDLLLPVPDLIPSPPGSANSLPLLNAAHTAPLLTAPLWLPTP